MECTNLVDPHQLLCPGLLSYSYYFAYIPPTICSQDRLSTKSEVYFGFSRTPENTYPRGKHGEIKVHRSSACCSDSIQTFCYDDLYRLFYFNHILYKDTINFTSLKLDFINESLMKIQKAYEFLENYFLRNLTGFIFFIIMYLG